MLKTNSYVLAMDVTLKFYELDLNGIDKFL